MRPDVGTQAQFKFIQISDDNVHHVRELMDEVFGQENSFAQVNFKSMQALGQSGLAKVYDYILWYVKDPERMKFRPLFREKEIRGDREYRFVDDPGCAKGYKKISEDEFAALNDYSGVFRRSALTSSGFTPICTFAFELEGTKCRPFGRKSWRTNATGIETLKAEKRLFLLADNPYFKLYYNDFPFVPLENSWTEQAAAESRLYVVQTAEKFVQRCMLMTTDPGDLALDPTCGSGTTAYVAEQWGRRWITIDTSRVPLSLARQRLLTATFPWYELKDETRGPAGGFVYERKQDNKGEEVGGIVPHVTLKSIANNEPPEEEVLVDRPESDNKITRVTGPFCVEGTIPTPVDISAGAEDGGLADSGFRSGLEDSGLRSGLEDSGFRSGIGEEAQSTFTDRMLEILRKSPLLRLEGNRTLALKNIRPPAKTLSLSAEAVVDATTPGQSPTLQDAVQEAAEKNGKALPLSAKPVALVFGPENGAISERLVQEAAKEASLKNYAHLYVIGFAIQPNARQLIENCDAVVGIPATYIQATPDLMMGDLLKNMRSSQIFSVCGLPEIKIHRVEKGRAAAGPGAAPGVGSRIPDSEFQNVQYEVELLGLDVFDPVTTETNHRSGNDVPAWFLDTDYNGLCFHVSQAFFPRTSAWDNLKKALKSEFEETVWDHLSGTKSAPFEAGENRQIAVKVIDDRGNELMVVEKLR
jgi:adenine-specific DNA-methyltransferase